MVPVTATPGADEFTPIFKFFSTITQGTGGGPQRTHTQKQKQNIGYRKPDMIEVRVPHFMTEIQGQRPKDCVLKGSKTLEQSEWIGRARPWRLAPKTNKTDLEP